MELITNLHGIIPQIFTNAAKGTSHLADFTCSVSILMLKDVIISVASLMIEARTCSVCYGIHFVKFYGTFCLWTIQLPWYVSFPALCL